MSFKRAIDFSLGWEGGYVDDPEDPGGETNYGISKRAHPAENIKGLTVADASRIYEETYWARTGGLLEGPSEGSGGALAAALLDFGIHSGVSRAVAELQRFVGAEPDGVVGPRTKLAIRLKADELLAMALVERRSRYLERVLTAQPELRKYEKGWRARLDSLASCIQHRRFG